MLCLDLAAHAAWALPAPRFLAPQLPSARLRPRPNLWALQCPQNCGRSCLDSGSPRSWPRCCAMGYGRFCQKERIPMKMQLSTPIGAIGREGITRETPCDPASPYWAPFLLTHPFWVNLFSLIPFAGPHLSSLTPAARPSLHFCRTEGHPTQLSSYLSCTQFLPSPHVCSEIFTLYDLVRQSRPTEGLRNEESVAEATLGGGRERERERK